MNIQTTETGMMPVSTAPSKEQLDKAIRAIYDLFEGRPWPYMLLGDTAKGAKEGKLYGDKIEIGILKKHLTPDLFSHIKTHIEYEVDRGRSKYAEINDNLIKYTYKENRHNLVVVPIEFKIIYRNYQFFKHPDHVIYNYDEFSIPNPLEKYLKARYIIR